MYVSGLGNTVSDAPNCKGNPLEIFNPACWQILWEYNFGTAEQKAAVAGLYNPDVVYPAMPEPAAPAAPTAAQLASTDPSQLPSVLVDAAAVQTQDNLVNYMNQVASGLDAAGNPSKSGLSTWAWIALGGAAAFGVYALTQTGGRRR